MKRIILLDAGPLGLLAYSRAISIAVQCNQWVQAMLSAGNEIVVPEIADYEVRRELVRGGLINGILRLDRLADTPGITYLPLTTQTMRRASNLWAEARRLGGLPPIRRRSIVT